MSAVKRYAMAVGIVTAFLAVIAIVNALIMVTPDWVVLMGFGGFLAFAVQAIAHELR